jgi:predicted small metal-binding protein
MKEVRCGEVGLFPDCDGVIRGETEEVVVAKSAEHAREVHGMTDDFTDENVEKIREHIRTT